MKFLQDKQFFKDAFGWGVALWFIGYALGIILFFIVSPSMVGWVIMPIGTFVTFWVLFRKIKSNSFKYYFLIAAIWTFIAIAFDYFFLVKVFNPADGYYKLDVYLYYTLTFILPILAGWKKSMSK